MQRRIDWLYWGVVTALAGLAIYAAGAQAVPLQTIGTFCGTFPSQCQKGSQSLLAARGIGTDAYYVMEVDPTTGGIPVVISGSSTVTMASEGTPGAVNPSKALQIAGTDGTDLRTLSTTTTGILNVTSADTTLTGSLASPTTGDVIASADVSHYTHFSIYISLGSANIQVQASDDNTNWSAVLLVNSGSPTATPLATVSIGGLYVGDFDGKYMRVRVTSNNSGTVDVTMFLMDGPRHDMNSRYVGLVTGTTVQASNFPSTVDVNQGTPGASTLRVIPAGRPIGSSIIASNDYSSTNVTTAAYVQLIASTANAVNNLCLSNSSGSVIIIATGAAASESDRIYLPAGGSGCYTGLNLPVSTRVSLKALDQTASTGFFLFTGY